jgi:hypothetical protein
MLTVEHPLYIANTHSSYFAGSIGIGTTNPMSKLQVNAGEVQIGSSGASCSASNAGAIRYASGILYVCDSSNWDTIAAGTNQPAAFSFTNQTGVATSTTISSNAVTLTGFTGTISATCGTGCTAIARNGNWGGTTVSGFQSGDTIAIRQTSSSSQNTATNANVTAGSTTSGTWTVTTTTGAPNAFSFTDVTGATTGWTVQSNAVTLSGFTGSLTALCNTDCTAIGVNGVWGGTTNTVSSGQTIAIAQVASISSITPTTASITVGNTTSSTWTVTTAADTCAGYDSAPGTVCPNGEIYAGVSPDTNAKMYTTPCDAGYYWSSGACVACSSGLWSGSGSTCSTTYRNTSLNLEKW